MKNLQTHYFARAHSSSGLTNLINTNLVALQTGYILVGNCEFAKRKILSYLAQQLTVQGISIECVHSCFEPDALDGIILRKKGVAVFTDDALKEDSLMNVGICKEYQIGPMTTSSTLEKEIAPLKSAISLSLDATYHYYGKAKQIHDEWEQIYIQHMNFEDADSFSHSFIKTVFANCSKKTGGITRHRFFGGSTYHGPLNYVPEIIQQYENVYYIKGRPGSGKSTFLKKIQHQAECLGMDVMVYHCSFDIQSLDMIEIPELNFVIFDSTAPHEFFPSSKQEHVIDMYEKFMEKSTDETYKSELAEIGARYQALVAMGTKELFKAHEQELKLTATFEKEITREEIVHIRKELLDFLL